MFALIPSAFISHFGNVSGMVLSPIFPSAQRSNANLASISLLRRLSIQVAAHGLIPVYSRRDDSRTSVHPQFSKPIQLSKSDWGSSLISRPSHLELCFFCQYYTKKEPTRQINSWSILQKFLYGRHWRINVKTQSRPGRSVMLCYWMASALFR